MPEHPNWEGHNQLVKAKTLQPSQALQQVLNHANGHLLNGKFVADLGCGAGTDTLYLLNKGCVVLAIDKDKSSLEKLTEAHQEKHLIISCQAFEHLQLPSQLDLINSSFSLPFCHPSHFNACWQAITNAIKPGGYFSGHFFGHQDSWAIREDMTFHTAEEIKSLFSGFEILWQEETEKDGKTLGGTTKHWHVFHIAARKL